jgi:hypothetical protein
MSRSIGLARFAALAAAAVCSASVGWSAPSLAQREPSSPGYQPPASPPPSFGGNRAPSGPWPSSPPQASPPSTQGPPPSSGGGSKPRQRPRDDGRRYDYGHRDYDREDWRYRNTWRYRLYERDPWPYSEPYYATPRYIYPDPYYRPPPLGAVGTLYYCYDPAGYYPQVLNCTGGWVAVPPPG